MLSEISLPKLLTAWLVMLVVPCLVLGLSPLIVSAWAVKVFGNISFSYAGVWPIILLATLLAVGWLAGRTWRSRLGYTLFAFGAWDISYYFWLMPLTAWPTSLADSDCTCPLTRPPIACLTVEPATTVTSSA